MKRLIHWFSKPWRLAIFNFLLLITAVVYNSQVQVFCNPVPWAAGVLATTFLSTVLHPLVPEIDWLAKVVAFVNGVSLCVFIYCILFLAQMNLFGLFMILIGVGLITFVPHFLALQLVWKYLGPSSDRVLRWVFVGGIFFSLGMVPWFGYMYGNAHVALQKMVVNDFEEVETSFMVERMLGAKLIYHTRFCEYDGWRPPLHDPALNIGRWLYGNANPLQVDLEERLVLYQRFFPERAAKQPCSCAVEYNEVYHGDGLWER